MDGNLMSDVILSAYSASALRVSAVQALRPQNRHSLTPAQPLFKMKRPQSEGLAMGLAMGLRE
jgi:hypothetical protein